jgi:hypothetical protein
MIGKTIKLVGYGIDTLILNVRYTDTQGQLVKKELDEQLLEQLALYRVAYRLAKHRWFRIRSTAL